MPRRGAAPPALPEDGSDEGDDAPGAHHHSQQQQLPAEQLLSAELLGDSRGAAFTAACAMLERAREDAALCGPWPLTWAQLQQQQGRDSSAAWLERDLDASVTHKKYRTVAGEVTRKHVELACQEELYERMLSWLQAEALKKQLGGGGAGSSTLEDEPCAELKQLAAQGVALVLKKMEEFALAQQQDKGALGAGDVAR